MIGEQDLYAIYAAAMVLVTVAFSVAVARLPAERRRYYVPVVVVPAFAAVAFGAMSRGVLLFQRSDGRMIPLGRLLTYLVIYPITTWYIGWAGGLDRRETATLAVAIGTVVVGVAISWLVPALSSVGSLLVVGSLVVLGYLLVGPYDRQARDRPGECRLLYGKLRNLLLMLWVVYVVLALTSRQQLALLDAFAGVVFGNYLDLLAIVGFGVIVLRAREAMTIMIAEAGGAVSVGDLADDELGSEDVASADDDAGRTPGD